MFKRSMIIGLLAALAIVGFTGCKTGLSAPVGSKDDYTEIPAKDCELTIAPGTGYYCEVPLPTTMYYQGDTELRFEFTATGDTKIHYAEKLHNGTYSEVWAYHVEKDAGGKIVDSDKDPLKDYSSDNYSGEVDFKTDDWFVTEIALWKYNPDGGTAAEFFIWADQFPI